MKKLFTTAALAVSCTFANAGGSFMNAITLVTWLNNPGTQGSASGYIMGIADAGDGKDFCLPAGTDWMNLSQTIMMAAPMGPAGPTAVAYDSAKDFITNVFSKAYPCRPRNSSK